MQAPPSDVWGSRDGSPARLGPRALALWALWFGVLTALAETAVVTLARAFTNRLIYITPDIVWVAPVANVVMYGITAAALYALTRRMTRETACGTVAGVFLFLGVLGPLLQVPQLHPYAALTLAAGVALQGARIALAHTDRVHALIRRTLPWVLVPCVVLGIGYPARRELGARRAEAALPTAQPGTPNVILIVLDTVRASNLSLYGYHRATSPNLSEFARSGVVFDNALATAPWTLPSHASMFTGRLPKDLTADWQVPLDGRHRTLAETLQARGYVTVGFVANLQYTAGATGLDRGFLRYSDFPFAIGTFTQQSWLVRPMVSEVRRGLDESDKMVRKSGARITDDFVRWLAARPRKPFFAFLNYFDAHSPYLPPAPFDTQFGSGGPMPDIGTIRQWSPSEIQRSMDAYDGALTYIDAQLGRLFQSLRAQDLLDNTLIIVTSDHGELFGEHGLFHHANSLYRPLLQVPLVVAFPSRVPGGLRVTEPVSLVDIAATIVDLSGDAQEAPLPGRSLAEHWSPHASSSMASPTFSEISKGINTESFLPVSKGRMLSVVVDGVHYIRNGDGTEELYDFAHDLSESANLAGRPEMQAKMETARRAVDTTLKRR